MGGCLKVIGILFGIVCVFSLIFATCEDSQHQEEKKKITESYRKAIKENDFETAHNILEDIHTEYKHNASFTLEAYSYVYGAEFRYLILNGDEAAKDRISYMFTEIPAFGEKIDTGTVYKVYHGNTTYFTLENKDFDNYLTYSKCRNGLCNLILDLAIQKDKYEFATLAIDHYVESVSFKKTIGKDEWDNEIDTTKIYYNLVEKEAAQAKLDKAIEDGKIQKSE